MEILKRFEEAKEIRLGHEQIWQTISNIVQAVPRRFNKYNVYEGEDWTRQSYDSTASINNERFKAIFLGLLTSPHDRWFRLCLRGEKPLNETTEFLQNLENIIFESYANNGFYRMASSVYESCGLFGNAMAFISEREFSGKKGLQGIRYVEVPVEQVYFLQDGNGDVKHVFRRVEWTHMQAASFFGEKQLPRKIRECHDNRLFSFIHEVKPERPDKEDTKYVSTWVSEDEKAIITEEKLKTSPYLPVRMPTYSGETYGRGPAYFCLPAIKTLNYYAYNRRESFGYVTNPRYIVRDNVNIKGWEDVGPGGLLYASGVGDVGPGAIRELSSVTHPEYYRIMASFEEDAIRKAFFADQIEFWMERPQDMKAGVASEIGARNRILLAPVLTAMSQTFVIPAVIKTIDTIFSAMVNRTDELKVTIPEQIMKNGMNIEITGPLAIAQKAARLSGYREFLADISPVIQMFPDTVQALNGDEIVRSLADSWYIPAGMINSTEKVIAARRAQQQKQQLEEQVGMLERGAPAMLDIAKATKELA